MQNILPEIIALLTSDNLIVIFIASTLILFWYVKNVLIFWESRKQLKIEKIEKALKSEYIKGVTRKDLEDELEVEYFFLIKGLYLKRNIREAIIEFIEKNDRISFTHFKRARLYIRYPKNKLEIEIKLVEILFYYFSNLVSVALLVIGLALIMPELLPETTTSLIIKRVSIGIYFIAMAMFFFYQQLPLYNAKIIKKELEIIHNKSNQRGHFTAYLAMLKKTSGVATLNRHKEMR